jgi:hypothetical protein
MATTVTKDVEASVAQVTFGMKMPPIKSSYVLHHKINPSTTISDIIPIILITPAFPHT